MAINNPVITDSDWLQAAAVAIQNKDGGGKIEVPDFASRIEAWPLSSPIFEQIVNRTVTGVVASNEVRYLLTQMFCEMSQVTGVILNSNPLFIGGPPFKRNPERMFDECRSLKYVIIPHTLAENTNSFGTYVFYMCTSLKLIVLNTMGAVPGGSQVVGVNNLTNLVITNDIIMPLSNANTFRDSAISNGTCNIYVNDTLKNEYKIATNWSLFANQFKGFSEAPSFDVNLTYTIGDLCKFNNKIYAWISETDGNSTPTGNVDEFNDWYCIANISEGSE